MADLHQELAQLSPERRRLVELLLRQQAQAAPELSSPARIPPRRPTEPCPLSFAQQSLWFAQQWDPGSTAYNFSIAVRLRGSCELHALERSLQAITQRHAVLRTTFIEVEGQPLQSIAPTLLLPLRCLDLQALPLEVRAAQVEQLARVEVERPFDLVHGPLLRAGILRLSVNEHVLLITIHHIVFDDWSQGILVRELFAHYTALQAGRAVPLAALPLEYADYASWQRRQLPGSKVEEHLAYWTEQLRDVSPLLELPIDYPRPAMRTLQGANYTFVIPMPLTERLKALSQQAGITLFMTLLAAFDVLLYRYSGQDDIVVGTPIAGRMLEELEGLIGLFANMLALRVDVGGNPSFSELLQRVRTVALAAYTHRDISFEQVVQTLAIGHDCF